MCDPPTRRPEVVKPQHKRVYRDQSGGKRSAHGFPEEFAPDKVMDSPIHRPAWRPEWVISALMAMSYQFFRFALPIWIASIPGVASPSMKEPGAVKNSFRAALQHAVPQFAEFAI
jgi:hypothetical protein